MVQDIGTIGLPALRSFATVARLGGISAAAQRLGMAKSGVSRHIAQLEAHFGVRLLERSARSVKLTPVGQLLEGRVKSILAELEMLDDIAREESGGIAGQVSIAATPEFGGLVARGLFPKLQARHPDLKVVMRTAYEFEDMQDPRTDLALRVGTFKDDRLVANRLGAFQAWMVASPAFLETHPVNAPEDLGRVPCLVFRGDQTTSQWTLFGRGQELNIGVDGPVGVRSFTVLMDLALAHHGVAFIPKFMVHDALRDGRLRRCLPDLTSRDFNVFLTYRPGARRVARLDATISIAEEHIRELLKD